MIRPLLLALALSITVHAKDLGLQIPGLPHEILISLPENFDPANKHPTLFYYHGTSGRPTTSLMRRHAGPDDWVIVGMTYNQEGKFTLSPETWTSERKAYHAVRKLMIAKHGTDPDKLYLAGFSKGGWHTNLMLQSEPTVSGGIIMGAGHLHLVPGALEKYSSKKPVHIGIGRSDGNYPFALNALLQHRRLGGEVTLEEWPTLGHDFPDKGSEALTQWLTMRVKNHRQLESSATKTLTRHLSDSKSLNPLKRWDRLRVIKQMPFFLLANSDWKHEFQKTLAALESLPEVAVEASLLAKHRRLLHQEITNNTLSSLKKVNLSYLDLSSQHPETRQGKLLEIDFERTEKLLKHFEAQEKLKPAPPKLPEREEAPDFRRKIPRSPLIR